MKKITILLLLLGCLFAQSKEKKVLTIEDFASWKRVANSQISIDGKLISFEINPQKGDGTLFLKSNNGKLIKSFTRGYSAKISGDGKFIAFKIKQPADSIRKAKFNKVSKKKMPMDSLGVYSIADNKTYKFADVKKFDVSDENSDWIAFTAKEVQPKKKAKSDKEEKKSEEVKKEEESKTEKSEEKKEKPKKAKKKGKNHGDRFFIFNVTSNDTIKFNNVVEFNVAEKGESIGFIRHLEDSLFRSKVYSFNTKTKSVDTILCATGKATKLITDEIGEQTAFLFSADTIKEKVYDLYLSIDNKTFQKIVSSKSTDMPEKWAPSENGRMRFSENGERLYFGTALAPVKEPKDSLITEEKAKVDVWSWTDIEVIPEQRIKSAREKKRTFSAVYHIQKGKYIQLADEVVRSVRPINKGNGDIGIGINDRPYKKSSSWNARWHSDYYLVNVTTGEKHLLVEDKANASISPAGKYFVWYDHNDSSYYSRSTDLQKATIVSLTKKLPVEFYNETHDSPSDPRGYGIAGWSEDDKYIYINDRFDIWQIDPSGKDEAVNITNGFGRKNEVELRYRKLDRDEEFINIDDPVILESFSYKTKAREFYKSDLNKKSDPKLLIGGEFNFGGIIKAKDSGEIIWTKENVEVYPDLWISDLSFSNPIKLSEANPQQNDFNWVIVEKIKWQSFTGETLEGLVYKPENFDPTKKYPVVVYFYEMSSQRMHSYIVPSPSRSIINKSFYPSNGYIVFVPDITYKVGYPGQSAYNAIVSGTNHLIVKYPWIDAKRIALQGQSWGGYQTAFLVTQTDMFAAAMGGAVVSNMTSAYGGIRWGSGLARTFQYEHTQSRIGGTLWEKTPLYIENSPLFHVPKINTPLMLMHNDKDGAVPWYQGIEMFLAMRRLNKPVWMLNYNDEPHNLKSSSWANRMDLSKRMKQFFDHYLKDAPMPEWMFKGIPYTEKGKNDGFKLIK